MKDLFTVIQSFFAYDLALRCQVFDKEFFEYQKLFIELRLQLKLIFLDPLSATILEEGVIGFIKGVIKNIYDVGVSLRILFVIDIFLNNIGIAYLLR